MLNKPTHLAAPLLEPTTQAFIDGLAGATPISTLSVEEARTVLAGAAKSPGVRIPDATIKDLALPVGPAGMTNVRVIRPVGADGALPAIIYMHGGGWVLGDRETHDRLVRELAVGANAALVFVDYDRAPESRFPMAIEQGYAVARYVADNASKLKVDAGRMVIAGDSVGGNMATVIALMSRERKGPKFEAQVLLYPVTDASMTTDSYEDFANGPWLTKMSMAWFWDQYLPTKSTRSDIHASPLNASAGDLADLPPTLLIVDENDVLRDEGEAYGRKLAQAGVRVTSVRYNGTVHDFMMLNPLATTPAVRGAVGQTIGYLRHVFAA